MFLSGYQIVTNKVRMASSRQRVHMDHFVAANGLPGSSNTHLKHLKHFSFELRILKLHLQPCSLGGKSTWAKLCGPDSVLLAELVQTGCQLLLNLTTIQILHTRRMKLGLIAFES